MEVNNIYEGLKNSSNNLFKDLTPENINEGDKRLFHWVYDGTKGGSFMDCLFITISKADTCNTKKLLLAYENEVIAYYNYSNNPTYWDRLVKIMNGN